MKRAWLLPLCLTALVAAAAGCKSGPATAAKPPAANVPAEPIKAVPDKDRYKVTADTTGFFRYSPLEVAGSDFDLKKNARLTMLKRGRGFSQIKTADNQIGYVGTEDIAPLAPGEIAQEDAATLQAAEAAAGAQSSSVIAPSADVPLTTVSGKKSAAVVEIPSDAGRNERLPVPDATPTPKGPR